VALARLERGVDVSTFDAALALAKLGMLMRATTTILAALMLSWIREARAFESRMTSPALKLLWATSSNASSVLATVNSTVTT